MRCAEALLMIGASIPSWPSRHDGTSTAVLPASIEGPARADRADLVQIHAERGVDCRARAFRLRGRLGLTVAVKATFQMVPGQPMTSIAAHPIIVRDRHHDDDPSQSLVVASELAPYRPGADVLLRGHACAPAGTSVRSSTVRLMIYRGEHVLLFKQLVAQGDDAGGTPFERMPLRYERTTVGPHGENPVGVPPTMRPPNLFDPSRPGRPAGFGPIARSWPARARLLGAFDSTRLEDPILELPDDFPWLFFHAAPSDQRLSLLHGDEHVVLDGMTSFAPWIDSQLPGVSGVAFAHRRALRAGPGQPISMVADTLSIDADTLCCSMIWRGVLALSSDAELDELAIVADLATTRAAPPVAPVKAPTARACPTTRVTRVDASPGARPPAAVLPFVAPIEGASIPMVAPRPRGPTPRAARGREADSELSTADLLPEAHRQIASKPATPFRASPPSAPPSVAPPSITPALSAPPSVAERREPALPPDPKSLGAHFLTEMALLMTRADAPPPH